MMDEIGRQLGAEMAARQKKQTPFAEDAMAGMGPSLSEMGWGEFVIDHDVMKAFRLGRSDMISIKIKMCAFYRVNLGGQSPLCHFVVGLMKGALSELQGERLRAWEELCTSKGDDFCEVVVARR